MGTYRVNTHIRPECGEIQGRTAPNANTFHAVDVGTLLRYFDTIVL